MQSRVAILTRSFWPIAGNAELKCGTLAKTLKTAGHPIAVFTSQWEPDWASRFEFREVAVQRINRTTGGAWAKSRFQKSVTKVLQQQCPGWETILVLGGAEEIDAAVRAKKLGGPQRVYFRFDGRTRVAAAHSLSYRRRLGTALTQVDGIWVNEPTLVPELNQWFGNLTTFHIPDEPERLDPWGDSVECQPRMREAIGDIHPLLELHPRNICGVYSTEFNDDDYLFQLIDAWVPISHRFAEARLWITGDGPQASRAWQQINDQGLSASVILTGNFDHLQDAYRAADFYIHPDGRYLDCTGMIDAMAAGLPVVFPNSTVAPAFVQDHRVGLTFVEGSESSLSETMMRMIREGKRREQLGRGAATAVEEWRGTDTIVSYWNHLLDAIPQSEMSLPRDS